MSELDFLAYVADSFGPTKTYARREFCWIPVKQVGPDNLLGRLVIKLQHAKSGVHRNVEVDSYLIEQDTPEPGDHGGRAFWLHNQTDPRAEVYRCVVGGLTPHCGCKAGKCRVPGEAGVTEGCKHRDCLLELIARDLLPGDPGSDNERSGQWHTDEPGEMTQAEIYAEIHAGMAEV